MNHPPTGDPHIATPIGNRSCLSQVDLFPEIAVVRVLTGVDKLIESIPDPCYWTESEKNELVVHLIAAMWDDVVALFKMRLDKENGNIYSALLNLSPKILPDYIHTLDWLMGNHVGAIPLTLVLAYENNVHVDHDLELSVHTILKLLRSHPVLRNDCFDLDVYKKGGKFFTNLPNGESDG